MPGTPDETMRNPRCWNCTLNLENVRLMTVAEAAGVCEVSSELVRQWMAEGDVEWLRLPSGAEMLLADSLPTGERPLRALRVLRGGPPPDSHHEAHEGHEARCFVCGLPAPRERILLEPRQVMKLCRVQRRTLARWTAEALAESVETPSGRLYYLDSLFQEPRRHRDLEVRR